MQKQNIINLLQLAEELVVYCKIAGATFSEDAGVDIAFADLQTKISEVIQDVEHTLD